MQGIVLIAVLASVIVVILQQPRAHERFPLIFAFNAFLIALPLFNKFVEFIS
jgi:hypothetical protein